MATDPQGYNEANLHSFNRYTYGNNNPYRYTDPDGHSPLDIAFLVVDGVQLGRAIYSGAGITEAAINFGMSAVGVISPVPGVGLALKEVRAVVHAADAIKEAGHAREAAQVVEKSVSSGRAAEYEVGKFSDLAKRSKGDGLEVHHAVQKHPAGQAIPGYDPRNGPSIILSREEHRRIPTIKGEYGGSARDLLAKDIRDLRNNTNGPNSSLRELTKLNKDLHPGAFSK